MNKLIVQAEEALSDIGAERSVIEQNILRQELSPVIYHWYRKVMGRDPSKAEYDIEIAKVNYGSGTLDITALKNQLLASPEYAARSLEVQQIKDRVTSKLRKAVSGTPAERAAELSALGLSESEVIALTSVESEQILTWLNAQSLHFGQSAFIAFEALQRDAGYSISRLSLAASLILIDILTGTITPKESGDLVISLYAMRRLAEKRGLNSQKSYAVNYEALKAMCAGDGPTGDGPVGACPSRVIAHINGNHFVLITKVTDTEISYTDPGAGAESALEVVTVSKEEFLLTWLDPRNPDAGVGYVMSLQTPVQGRALTSNEEMSVRGAFFPFIAIAIAAVIKAVVAVVAATIAAVSALVSAMVGGISSILSGLGSMAQGFFTGNFMAGLTSGFQSIASGISQIFGSVFQAMGQFGKVFVSTFKAGGFTSFVHGTASGAGNFLSGFMASSAFKGFLATTGIGMGLQGTGKLLEGMGVSPKITNVLVSGGKLAVGVGLLATGNPMGLALVTGGTSEFLSRHTNLSPTVSTLISLGAASVAGFAGGLIDTGSIAGSLASLKDITIPYLSKELAVSGFTAIGSSLGLNPAVTSLISVPVRAVAGGISGGSLSPSGILTSIKDALVSRETVGGLLSVGAAIGLNTLGAPPILQSFIPNLLAQLTASGSGSTGGGGGPGSILIRIGDFAKNIGQTVVNSVEKVGQTIVSFGQTLVNGFGQAVEKVSSLIPPQIKEFFIGKGNGDLAAGVNSVAVTNSDIAESAFGDYRITYSHTSNDLTFANDRLTTTVRNVEFGQSGDIFTAGIEISEDFGGGNLVREVYDNDGVLQELRFNDDVEILLNNNPFNKTEPLNFENAVTRLMLGDLDKESFIEFRNEDGKLSGDIKIDVGGEITLTEGVKFLNDIGQTFDLVQNVIGIPVALADGVERYGDLEPPQGKYAIKWFIERPQGNEFGDKDKFTTDAFGVPHVGHVFVGIVNAQGEVQYRGLTPATPYDLSALSLHKIGDLFKAFGIFANDRDGYIETNADLVSPMEGLHRFDVGTDWYVIDEERYTALLNFIDRPEGHRYNLCTNSCAGFSQKLAEIANISLPFSGLFFPTPQEMADAVEKEQKINQTGS